MTLVIPDVFAGVLGVGLVSVSGSVSHRAIPSQLVQSAKHIAECATNQPFTDTQFNQREVSLAVIDTTAIEALA